MNIKSNITPTHGHLGACGYYKTVRKSLSDQLDEAFESYKREPSSINREVIEMLLIAYAEPRQRDDTGQGEMAL